MHWNLADDNGSRVAAGVYFIRVRQGADTDARSIVVVRLHTLDSAGAAGKRAALAEHSDLYRGLAPRGDAIRACPGNGRRVGRPGARRSAACLQYTLCIPERAQRVGGVLGVFVCELRHEIRGALVLDIPERLHDASRPGILRAGARLIGSDRIATR